MTEPLRPPAPRWFSNSADSSPLRAAPWGVPTVLVVLGMAFVLFFALSIPAGLLAGPPMRGPHGGRNLSFFLAATFLFDCCLLGIAWLFALRRHGLTFWQYGYRAVPGFGLLLAVLGFFGAYIILWAYIGISFLPHLSHLRPSSNIPGGEEALRNPSLAIQLGVLACLIAPFVEETFFRGFVFRGLLNMRITVRLARGAHPYQVQFWTAALASGFVFALAHGQPGLFIPFTGVGALFAWIFWRSGSIWPNIIAHAAFNSASFLVGLTHH